MGKYSRQLAIAEIRGQKSDVRGHPLKGPVKEKTVLHRKLADFLQDYLRPAAVWSPLLSAPCFSFDGGVGPF